MIGQLAFLTSLRTIWTTFIRDMQFFLNEVSLTGQFNDPGEFESGLKRLNGLLQKIVDLSVPKVFYKTHLVYLRFAMSDRVFSDCLESVKDRSVRANYKRLLKERLRAEDWLSTQLHGDDIFEFDNDDVVGSSLAEAAERKIRDEGLLCVVVSFDRSRFDNIVTLTILKNFSNEAKLSCISDEDSFQRWRDENCQIKRREYNYALMRPPRDEETVLILVERFRRSGMIYDGRAIYCEFDTRRLFYVDNFHWGLSAHLEVFDNTGSHLGIADLDGNLDNSAKVDGRRIAVR